MAYFAKLQIGALVRTPVSVHPRRLRIPRPTAIRLRWRAARRGGASPRRETAATSTGSTVSAVSTQAPASPAPTALTQDPLSNQAESSVEQLVAEVQARNPSLEAASAAWRAAAERHPQAVLLDDPMFSHLVTPTNGLGVDGGGFVVQALAEGAVVRQAGPARQRGRGRGRGLKATSATSACGCRRRWRTVFYDVLSGPAGGGSQRIDVSPRGRVPGDCLDKYQVNQAPQQDVLQADVELATIESRRGGDLRRTTGDGTDQHAAAPCRRPSAAAAAGRGPARRSAARCGGVAADCRAIAARLVRLAGPHPRRRGRRGIGRQGILSRRESRRHVRRPHA